jgi:hypothetical protein
VHYSWFLNIWFCGVPFSCVPRINTLTLSILIRWKNPFNKFWPYFRLLLSYNVAGIRFAYSFHLALQLFFLVCWQSNSMQQSSRWQVIIMIHPMHFFLSKLALHSVLGFWEVKVRICILSNIDQKSSMFDKLLFTERSQHSKHYTSNDVPKCMPLLAIGSGFHGTNK